MPIEITFHANSVAELHKQMRDMLTTAVGMPVDPAYRPWKEGTSETKTDIVSDTVSDLNHNEKALAEARAKKEPEPQPEKPRRAHRRVNPKPEPAPEPQPEPQPEPDLPDVDLSSLNREYEEPEAITKTDPVEDEKLKAAVINDLQALFTAGKVKVIRGVLDTYGNGAKSFPEIDAHRFHAIKRALAAGEFA